MAIWRIETCKLEAGYKSHASIYKLIREGLWTKPVRLGMRSVGWPEAEVTAICKGVSLAKLIMSFASWW